MSSGKSEQTRRKILEATWKLLESEAGQKTRMADIAREASVSRQAVYLHFPNRAELLVATTNYIDTVEDVAGRLETVNKAEGGEQRLHAFVHAWGNYIPIIYRVANTLLNLKSSDADAAEAWEDRMQSLKAVCRTIVEELDSEKRLKKSMTVDEATDVMWALVSVYFWEMLTVDQNFNQARYIEIMETMLRSVLIKE